MAEVARTTYLNSQTPVLELDMTQADSWTGYSNFGTKMNDPGQDADEVTEKDFGGGIDILIGEDNAGEISLEYYDTSSATELSAILEAARVARPRTVFNLRTTASNGAATKTTTYTNCTVKKTTGASFDSNTVAVAKVTATISYESRA